MEFSIEIFLWVNLLFSVEAGNVEKSTFNCVNDILFIGFSKNIYTVSEGINNFKYIIHN